MARATTKGNCIYCGQLFSKGGISRHLETCANRREAIQNPVGHGKSKPRLARLFHLQVFGAYDPNYWMNIELLGDASLGELDAFLRAEWLECCGHLSAFTIKEQMYSVYPEGGFLDDLGMDHKLEQVLAPGMEFAHEYDFGSTTHLTLKVVAVREGMVRGRPIDILAQNQPPAIKCAVCGEPATQVCSQCIWEGSAAWLCDEHAAAHECGEEMFLPVANSPRVGVCGYTGPGDVW